MNENIKIILRSGVEIETTYCWEEIKYALNEDANDGEVVFPLTNGKWVCIVKEEICAYLNII